MSRFGPGQRFSGRCRVGLAGSSHGLAMAATGSSGGITAIWALDMCSAGWCSAGLSSPRAAHLEMCTSGPNMSKHGRGSEFQNRHRATKKGHTDHMSVKFLHVPLRPIVLTHTWTRSTWTCDTLCHNFLYAPEAVSSFGSCSAGLFASWWAHQAATSLGNTARAWRQMEIKRPDAGFLLHRSNQTLFWNMLLSEKYQMMLTWKRQDEQQGFQTDTFWLFLSGFYSILQYHSQSCQPLYFRRCARAGAESCLQVIDKRNITGINRLILLHSYCGWILVIN